MNQMIRDHVRKILVALIGLVLIGVNQSLNVDLMGLETELVNSILGLLTVLGLIPAAQQDKKAKKEKDSKDA